MMGSCEKKVAGKGSLQTLLNDEEITPAYRPVVRRVSQLWATFDFAPLPFGLIGKAVSQGVRLSWSGLLNDGRREELHDRRIGTSAGCCRRGRGLSLKFLWCAISQCRMQPQTIVISADELFHMLRKLVEIGILVTVDFLLF